MPVYDIEGKRYRSDTALTPEELEELSAPSTLKVMLESARKGLAGLPSSLAGIGEVMATYGVTPMLGGGVPLGMPQMTPQGVTQAYKAGKEAVYKPAMAALGSTGAEPQTGGQKILAAGTEAMFSPESYAFPPLAATKRLGLFGQALMRPTEQAVVGAGAETGGQAGEYAGGKAEMPLAGRILGSLLGGATSAYGLGTAARVTELAATKGFDLARDTWTKIKGGIPEDKLMQDVDNRISTVFIAAGAADPNFLTTLEAATKAQKSVSLKAPGGADVQMPLSALLADNPVINTFIQNLSAKDPVFRAQYGAQYEAAKQALVVNQMRLFGDPSKVQLKIGAPDLTDIQVKRVRSIDEQISDLSKDRTIDPPIFGQRISALVEQKEKAARISVKPSYDEAFDIAKTKNLELPSSSVDDIYGFVVGAQASDIFKTFPSIYNRVRAKFRPEVTEPSAILTAEGKPTRPAGVKFSAATIEDLDSLKIEINAQLRKTSNDADIRLLTELKSRVSGHIDALDADFVTAYRNADKAYFEKVGLPFNSEALKSIDRKKFVEQISPAIIGNKSSADEFIRATGAEGTAIVRDAFFDSFTKAALKNDVIDIKAANKWLKTNQGGVSIVPGLEDELRGSVDNVQKLIAERVRLNAAFKRVAGEQIISENGFKSPQELVAKMYGDLAFTSKFMSNSQYGQNKDAVNAVRSFMLDDIVNAGSPLTVLADRNKAAIFNRVFGPTYAQKVQDFALASDRLAKDVSAVPFRSETVAKTPVEQLTGIPPEQIISRIYDRVSGPVYAMSSLFSKYWAKTASAKTEEKLKALLLNPSDAVKVFNALEPRISGFNQQKISDAIEVGKKYGLEWVADAVSDIRTGAMRGAVQGTEE